MTFELSSFGKKKDKMPVTIQKRSIRKGCYMTLCGLCCLAVLLIVILIPVSIKQVEQTELAIEENTLTMQINKDVKSEGRYLAKPESKFHKFQRILQPLAYLDGNEIHCKTNEGLNMILDINVQYQLQKENLVDLFYEYGTEEKHRKFIDSTTRSELKDVCTFFSGEDYYLKRGDIELSMAEGLEQVYNVSHTHADFALIQLRNIQHPKAYEDANRAKQQEQQKKEQKLRARNETLTRAKTDLKAAQVDARIKMIDANATANAVIGEAQAAAPAEIKSWEERTRAFFIIRQGMGEGVTNDQFLDYVESILVIREQENPIIQLDN